ncbi:UvrD-helicase domain-containing protein [Marisediminicola sp. LYQ134]|uniref:nuclease-related domain-containing DEAD/DEAH box helicase n=1 Tax=Marisediminicola sp. LYQ134 TaxID=3391061 RepID=UPI003983BE55
MGAGHSAAGQAALFQLEAEQLAYAQQTALEMHRRYSAAASSEAALGAALEPLEERGFRVFADRAWPGTRSGAQVDFVVVGPSGVWIVDAKSWRDVRVQGDRVFQGQDDVTERLDNLTSLIATTQSDLAEIGVAPGEIHAAAVFTNKGGVLGRINGIDLVGIDRALKLILGRGQRLGPVELAATADRVELLFAPLAERRRFFRSVPREPVVPVSLPQALITVDELEASLLAFERAKPIEEWMAFLHPDQARLAKRSFNGPSRIRGSAGTGKTVVGLHRAAHLARTTPGRVLVTTFVRTLPDVLESLMQRMAPEVAHRVDFMGVHEFAREVLKDRGIRLFVDQKKADIAFDAAWLATGSTAVLLRVDRSERYWKEEIFSVIKGRGIKRFEDYAQLSRVGRRRGLNPEQRHAVWELYSAYDSLMRARGLNDYADLILRAERSLRDEPLDTYSAVVVDEAQDLSCSMIRMLHHVVGDRPDGLNLIGDGRQTIYPGGYTLSEMGISIAGRGVIMTQNYRNTVEIVDFAGTLIAGDDYVDIEGETSPKDAAALVSRRGAAPTVTRFPSRSAHDKALVAHVVELLRTGCAPGDIGVLAPHTWATRDIRKALELADIATIDLLNYRGAVDDKVKVGTIKRAKGLEFKQVLVARTPAALLDDSSVALDSSEGERRELDRRELYVAMTRARDGLWVGVA